MRITLSTNLASWRTSTRELFETVLPPDKRCSFLQSTNTQLRSFFDFSFLAVTSQQMAVFWCCCRKCERISVGRRRQDVVSLREVMRRFHQTVLCFQNATRFVNAGENVISFAATRKIRPSAWRCSRKSYLTRATNCLLTKECRKWRQHLIYPLKYDDHSTNFHETLKP